MTSVIFRLPWKLYQPNRCRTIAITHLHCRKATIVNSISSPLEEVMERVFPVQDFASNVLNRSIAGRRSSNFIEEALAQAGTKILLVAGQSHPSIILPKGIAACKTFKSSHTALAVRVSLMQGQ